MSSTISHGAEQHDERELDAADRSIVQRLHHHGRVEVVARELTLEPRGDRRHLLLRRGGVHAGREPPDAVEIHAAASALLVVVADRQPEPRPAREVEAARRDADNRPRDAADLDRLADHIARPPSRSCQKP